MIMDVPVADVGSWEKELLEFARSRHAELVEKMKTEAKLSADVTAGLHTLFTEFGKIFKPTVQA